MLLLLQANCSLLQLAGAVSLLSPFFLRRRPCGLFCPPHSQVSPATRHPGPRVELYQPQTSLLTARPPRSSKKDILTKWGELLSSKHAFFADLGITSSHGCITNDRSNQVDAMNTAYRRRKTASSQQAAQVVRLIHGQKPVGVVLL